MERDCFPGSCGILLTGWYISESRNAGRKTIFRRVSSECWADRMSGTPHSTFIKIQFINIISSIDLTLFTHMRVKILRYNNY
jgi:hypothetical protein